MLDGVLLVAGSSSAILVRIDACNCEIVECRAKAFNFSNFMEVSVLQSFEWEKARAQFD